jgi:hypothetical protein
MLSIEHVSDAPVEVKSTKAVSRQASAMELLEATVSRDSQLCRHSFSTE